MKNKLIKIAILSVFTLGVLSSCERELDQTSFSQIPLDKAMDGSSQANFTQAINGAYSAIKGSGYFSVDTGNQIIVPDLTTDNLIYNPQGRGSNFTAYNWSFSANNGSVTGLFTQAYFVISRANMPLYYINNLPAGAFRNNIEANARAIRAAAHFDLVRAYCKIPTQSADANASLGIPYITEFNPLENSTIRNLTVAQVYDNIISDLNFAANNITDSPSDKSKFSKAAIYGLLSRVYLYKGDYNNAVSAGNQSISLSSSVGTRSTFTNIWASNNVDGVLFKVLNSTQENVTVGVAYQQGATSTGGSVRSEYVVPKSLNDLYTSTDIRKTAYIRTSAYQGVQRNHVIKWAFNTGGATPLNVVEVKYLRTAEVYLNVAEAAYRLGNETLANSLLNNLKAQRYSPYTPATLTGTALFNEIMLQRRLELAFENDRYYTFKRLGLPMQRTGEGPNVDGTGTASVVQTIQPADTRWQWPIPQSTINVTPSFQQNPGY
ncbi:MULTISPECIES: RagB/SusD family nutrient uptake outer membrane protein [Chryseobacterium]|uniref:RagB/SusD family nutrient uptake outer membrane protein n=1 Tax=Chryseobacterium urinae TaxID=3058400 RepID=A0ABT8U6U6_9FLAO|nr:MULTISPECIES: RagB/SusD family nutrient uptake outer membrane protein [unclassified Chryseobacterium]MDO3426186.1 RagB/SusD family nutrient uptake outer membrane protein [Chryseobacterium sp. APV1]